MVIICGTRGLDPCRWSCKEGSNSFLPRLLFGTWGFQSRPINQTKRYISGTRVLVNSGSIPAWTIPSGPGSGACGGPGYGVHNDASRDLDSGRHKGTTRGLEGLDPARSPDHAAFTGHYCRPQRACRALIGLRPHHHIG